MPTHKFPYDEHIAQHPSGDAPKIHSAMELDSRGGMAKGGTFPPYNARTNEDPQQSSPQSKHHGHRDLLEDAKPLSEILVNFALLLLLPVAASVFAAESVELAAAANDQSQTANQLALFTACLGNLTTDFCKDLVDQVDAFLPTIANKLYGVSDGSGSSTKPIAQVPKNPSVVLLKSTNGQAYIYSSVITFWVFIALIVLFALQYTIPEIFRWRAKRKRATRDAI